MVGYVYFFYIGIWVRISSSLIFKNGVYYNRKLIIGIYSSPISIIHFGIILILGQAKGVTHDPSLFVLITLDIQQRLLYLFCRYTPEVIL